MNARVRVVAWIVVMGPGVGLSAATAAPGDAPASSNQSVAVETPVMEAEPPPAPPETESGLARTLRRRPAVALTDALDADRAVPWYRTGLGALGIVLGLLAVVFLLLRRWAPSVRAPDSGVLKVLGRTGLTPKHSLALVQFGRRFVLVGISPDRVNVVSEVTDPDEAAELSGRIGVRWPAGGNPFDEMLTRETGEFAPGAGRADAERHPTGPAVDPPAPLRDLLGRLKALRSK